MASCARVGVYGRIYSLRSDVKRLHVHGKSPHKTSLRVLGGMVMSLLVQWIAVRIAVLSQDSQIRKTTLTLSTLDNYDGRKKSYVHYGFAVCDNTIAIRENLLIPT